MARTGRKKVDTFLIEDADRGISVKVAVFLVARGTAKLFACEERDLGIEEEDTDIQALHDRVHELVLERGQLAWQNWLYISVKGTVKNFAPRMGKDIDMSDRAAHGDIDLNITQVQVATTHSGKQVHRFSKDLYGPVTTLDKLTKDGLPPVGASNPYHGQEVMAALIPDTDENRAAIESIIAGMEQLRLKLHWFLHPVRAELSLAKLVGGLFLPAPEAEGK